MNRRAHVRRSFAPQSTLLRHEALRAIQAAPSINARVVTLWRRESGALQTGVAVTRAGTPPPP